MRDLVYEHKALTARVKELEAERDRLSKAFNEQLDQTYFASMERDRLRAALERIASNDRMTSPHPVGPSMGAGVSQGLEWNAKIAREALAGGKP